MSFSQRCRCLTGYVLAGGESRRMGRAKEKLPLQGATMLERQVQRLRSVTSNILVLGGLVGPVSPGVESLPDMIPGRGPLGGLYTGLAQSRTEYNFFLACDLPFVERRLLGYICRRAMESRADVTVPMSVDGRLQPLCAVYRRRVRGVIRARLAAGLNKVDGFFCDVRCHVIPWGELTRAGFRRRIFDNMNTVEDYERVKRLLESAIMNYEG